MRRMTGSQRKAKKKQRAMQKRRPKGMSHYITLYHGSYSLQDAHRIRQEGLVAKRASPFPNAGTNHRGISEVYNVLTTNKQYAKQYGDRRFRPVKKAKRSIGQTFISRNPYTQVYGKGRYKRRVAMVTKPKSIITVRIPRKKMGKYLVRGPAESRFMTGTVFKGQKQANSYGVRKNASGIAMIPRKYIK